MTAIFTVLILLVVLVNGWTDAPNAIAGCIGTRAMSPQKALILAAICNFCGAFGMAIISPRVAYTLYNIADFGDDPKKAIVSICAGLSAVIVWATFACKFGLPTSESHALISGISGAAIATTKSTDAINPHEWSLVLLGLAATTLLPFILGYAFDILLSAIFRHSDRRRANGYFLRAQKLGAACSALLHGGQDSQKFMGIYMLGISLAGGTYDGDTVSPIPIHVVIICSAVMTLGTALGGAGIIKKVGCDMTRIDPLGGSASDAASSVMLFICSLAGIPASTTHSKACAMIGAGFVKKRGVDVKVVTQIVSAWLLTFPICGILGFLLSILFSLFV